MCAIDRHSSTNKMCIGDSGSPLVIIDGDNSVQIGIASITWGCHTSNYVRVTSYLNWISKITGIPIVIEEKGKRSFLSWLNPLNWFNFGSSYKYSYKWRPNSYSYSPNSYTYYPNSYSNSYGNNWNSYGNSWNSYGNSWSSYGNTWNSYDNNYDTNWYDNDNTWNSYDNNLDNTLNSYDNNWGNDFYSNDNNWNGFDY